MSSWLIQSRYGHGAARIALRPVAYRAPDRRVPLFEGAALAWREMRAEGPKSWRSHLGGSTAVLAFIGLFLFAFVSALYRGTVDDSAVQIIAFRSEEPEPVVEVPLSPEPVEPEPPAAEPTPIARVEPKKPAPVLPPPKPPEPPPAARRVPPRRAPAPKPEPAKPVVRIDAVARAPEPPAPRVQRARTAPPVRAQALAPPPVSVDPLKAPRAPESPPPPSRAPRPEPIRRKPSAAPRPQLAMAAVAQPAVPASDVAPRFRRVRAKTPAPESTPRRPAPGFDLGAPSAPVAPAAVVAGADRPARARVPTPAPAPRKRPSLAAAGLGVPGVGDRSPAAPASTDLRRLRAPTPAPDTAGAVDDRRTRDPGLRGVPLGSLSACVSDALEESLKQKVISAVTSRKECASEAGTYRFVETRNLNAFLMTIERAGTRAPGDRCTELRLALECLQ